MADAADACADMLGTPRDESMLVENASVGAVIVAQRWMWKFVEQKAREETLCFFFASCASCACVRLNTVLCKAAAAAAAGDAAGDALW